MKLRLSYAGMSYWDKTWALETGRVVPEGIDLNFISPASSIDLFHRQANYAEFDVSEMSASTYAMMIARGDDRYIAIPVFPSRHFRHDQVYVNSSSGVDSPQDLAGKRVGILEYQMTAAVWIRGFLLHDFGVRPDQVDWWTGGLSTTHHAERFAHDLPEGVSLRQIPVDRTLEDMLETGELDALISVKAPSALRAGSGKVARLFPDYAAVEEDYYSRTGIFPIMHLIVVRRSIYEHNRWVASSLLSAFEESKRLGYERMHSLHCLAVGLPWHERELECTYSILGDDPFPYGFRKNKSTLDALTRYSFEQGLTGRRLEPSELFCVESLHESVLL